MKNSWLILCLACFTWSAYSQNEPIRETYWRWDDSVDSLRQTSRYLHTYNPSGLLIRSVYQIMKNDQWRDETNVTYVYNQNRQVITQQFESWINYSWIPTYRNIHFYNDRELLFKSTLQAWEEEKWVNVSLRLTENNITLHFSKETNQYWNNGQWVNHNQIINYLDEEGKLKSRLQKSWKDDKWSYEVRETFFYNESDEVSEIIIDNWDADHWETKGNYFHSYDNAHNILSNIFYHVNPLDGEEDFRWDYEYDESDNVIKEIFSTGSNEQWEPYLQNIHRNDPSGRKISLLSQLWSDIWLDQEFIQYDYSALQDTFLIYATHDLSIYPNPARTELHIKLTGHQLCPCTINITGMEGKTYKFNPTITENQLSIPIHNLAPGWYHLQLTSHSHVSSHPFIKY